jgi:hypothetical protein
MSRSSALSLRILEDRYAVCRLAPDGAVPDGLESAELLSVTRTPTELSIVCRETLDLPGRVERGWRCLAVDGVLEFDQVGILASLALPLAQAGISIFVVSTYDTDYLLVKQDRLESALEALRTAGHRLV